MVRPGDGEQSVPAFDRGTEWLRGHGAAADVVMSSRVRLARNLAGFPFLTRASRTDRHEILDLCRGRVLQARLADRILWVDLHESPVPERTVLAERHLISRQHAKGKLTNGVGGPDEPRGVAVALPDERMSIMVNEEDHLRLQAIRSGYALTEALEAIDAVDDALEAGLDYAFHPRFGYLTCCPTNVGTGVRFSVMLHLPGLKLTGELDKVKRAAEDMSLAVRGFYGEGSDAAGDFYQISNQATLGKTEIVLLHEIEQEIVPRVIDYERHARKTLLTRRRAMVDDKVHRALGALRHARLVSTEEAMELLSLVRLGVVTGLVDDVEQETVNRLMLLIQPAHLARTVGRDLDQQGRRVERAALLRAKLGP